MLPNLIHPDLGVAVSHVADVLGHEIKQQLLLSVAQARRPHARIVEHKIVLESLGHIVCTGLRGLENGLLPLRYIESVDQRETLLSSPWSTSVPWCLPRVVRTGSEPIKVGVMTT